MHARYLVLFSSYSTWGKIRSLVISKPFHPMIHHFRSLLVQCVDKRNRSQYCDKTLPTALLKIWSAAPDSRILCRRDYSFRFQLPEYSCKQSFYASHRSLHSYANKDIKEMQMRHHASLPEGDAACFVSTQQPKPNRSLSLVYDSSPGNVSVNQIVNRYIVTITLLQCF